MIFKIKATNGKLIKDFYYDNTKNFLYDDDGIVYEDNSVSFDKQKEYTIFSPSIPLKKSNKIGRAHV